ncbi:hypothetical protein NBRC111894_945 [Sporolactobacillus inulinus]|uniref:Uncharacterized protein n=1 Tax=Sporolactobacillus inulinus TaxID=2078 RepID=A0A4Y1Z920_9BACL|nr:hypothetical protein NBRC111894_945 [Sporolactobacillus inulinus]
MIPIATHGAPHSNQQFRPHLLSIVTEQFSADDRSLYYYAVLLNKSKRNLFQNVLLVSSEVLLILLDFAHSPHLTGIQKPELRALYASESPACSS